jgi:hypothetical protein
MAPLKTRRTGTCKDAVNTAEGADLSKLHSNGRNTPDSMRFLQELTSQSYVQELTALAYLQELSS